jgi:ubiquinone/menaquinone biosynthesis C-methylase UbiE
MKLLRRRGRFVAIGVDIYEPALRVAKERGTHSGYVLCDARQLPFANNSVDVVLCMETLEHLDKADGLRMLSDLERIAKRKLILSTPVGYLPSFASPAYDGNPHQIHISGWSPQEFLALGFRVYVGIFHQARRYFTERRATWAWMANIMMNSLLAPFTWFSPRLGSGMLCIKDLDGIAR